MEQSEKSGFDRAKYLIGFVILAAVVLVGITAYFGANSAKGTLGQMDSALDGVKAGNLPSAMPALNGSADAKATAPAQANGSAAAQQPATPTQANITPSVAGQNNATAAAKKEVVIDFLYADWCSHCQAMKPIVARLEAILPKDRFEVRYWNEASRGGNATVAAVYTDYSAKGYFQGFPTFVANGNAPKVGSMPEETFKAWVCSKFSAPKPTGC